MYASEGSENCVMLEKSSIYPIFLKLENARARTFGKLQKLENAHARYFEARVCSKLEKSLLDPSLASIYFTYEPERRRLLKGCQTIKDQDDNVFLRNAIPSIRNTKSKKIYLTKAKN